MIYLDNNATTRIAPPVLEAMLPFLEEHYANPSSSHSGAAISRTAIAKAREQVASLLGAQGADEIVFTSGGTESDNWAIRGALAAADEKKHIVTTSVEHEAVTQLCMHLENEGVEVTRLEVDRNGLVDLEELKASVREDTAIVSMMLANNETGVMFPVEMAAEIVKENSEALFHTDAVNAAGKVAINLSDTSIDLLSISGHKFHGPKGVGALFVRRGVAIAPSSIGGGQESGRRAGTEAVHQIAGLGKAAELVSDLGQMDDVGKLRDRLELAVLQSIPDTVINGAGAERLPNTANISFADTNGEMLLSELNQLGICVSTGSACNEGAGRVSPVLKAMDAPFREAMGAIRFSIGRFNTSEEIEFVLEHLPRVVADLRALAGASA